MSIAVSYFARQLAELGHEVTCYLATGEPIPWTHPLVEWRHRQLLVAPDEWPDLTITCSAPSWRRTVVAAQAAGAVGRLVYWHHYGPLPPGYGAILARVAPSTEQARSWSREIVLPPASWALYAGGERTGEEIVVPGGTRQKGGQVALQVAKLLPDLRWTVLSGRASEAELRPWRAVGTVLPPGLPPEGWLSRARLVLSPTRAETYGLAMAEAAVRGIPVVTSTLPGPMFALGDAATYLSADAPASAWAEAVQRALDAPPVRLQPQAYREVIARALSLGPPGRSTPRPPVPAWAPAPDSPPRPAPVGQPLPRRQEIETVECELPPLPAGGVVSILMAVGPVHRWLGEAVRSVLEQELPEGWRLELLLGIDGQPESLAAARALPPDPRLGIVSLRRSVGTYQAANTLLRHATGALVGRVDADDVQLPGRLAALIQALQGTCCGMANCRIADVDENLQPLRPYDMAADGIWLWRRDALDLLGGWMAWPCGADTELLLRARQLGLGEVILPDVLYLRRRHGEQLTRARGTGHGTPLREAAWGMIRAEKALGALGVRPQRIVPETSPCSLEGRLFSGPVWACLAAVPGRREILGQVVASLLPQVDRLGVYLNGWPDVPACLNDPRIVVARSQDHGDRGDAGKMFWTDEAPGYYLSCDDDLLYPADYARRLVAAIKARSNRAVAGVHGAILPSGAEHYHRDRTVLHYREALDVDTAVHVLGTGTAGWHAPSFRVRPSDFEAPNMADLWLAALGQRERRPFVCLARPAGWLQDLTDGARSIYQESLYRAGSAQDTGDQQDRLLRDLAPWALHEV
jgi:hypothetical protein